MRFRREHEPTSDIDTAAVDGLKAFTLVAAAGSGPGLSFIPRLRSWPPPKRRAVRQHY